MHSKALPGGVLDAVGVGYMSIARTTLWQSGATAVLALSSVLPRLLSLNLLDTSIQIVAGPVFLFLHAYVVLQVGA